MGHLDPIDDWQTLHVLQTDQGLHIRHILQHWSIDFHHDQPAAIDFKLYFEQHDQ